VLVPDLVRLVADTSQRNQVVRRRICLFLDVSFFDFFFLFGCNRDDFFFNYTTKRDWKESLSGHVWKESHPNSYIINIVNNAGKGVGVLFVAVKSGGLVGYDRADLTYEVLQFLHVDKIAWARKNTRILYNNMKKFNEWMEARKELVNEDTPHTASVQYGRFLGQIMGWDSHGDPNTFGGRITNFFAGGKHKKAQQMGADLYDTIANPTAITNIIARAQKDGVYRTSTFNACYEMVKTIAAKYNPSASASLTKPEFQSDLLHKILGKCHKSMSLDYSDAEDMYHDIMGTNPAAKKALSIAYDKDPKDLKDWLAAAQLTNTKPHPNYDPSNYHTAYWLIEAQGIVSPWNLIKMLVNKSPDKALSMPQNNREIHSYSTEFAEAYFPNIVNKRKAANASSNSGGGGGGKPDLSKLSPQERYGDNLDDLINVLNHFGSNNHGIDMKQADGSVTTGGKKAQLITALGSIIGPTAAATAGSSPDANSPLAKLADHTTFFGMDQLMESRKLD
jgi:hypothetical protein